MHPDAQFLVSLTLATIFYLFARLLPDTLHSFLLLLVSNLGVEDLVGYTNFVRSDLGMRVQCSLLFETAQHSLFTAILIGCFSVIGLLRVTVSLLSIGCICLLSFSDACALPTFCQVRSQGAKSALQSSSFLQKPQKFFCLEEFISSSYCFLLAVCFLFIWRNVVIIWLLMSVNYSIVLRFSAYYLAFLVFFVCPHVCFSCDACSKMIILTTI